MAKIIFRDQQPGQFLNAKSVLAAALGRHELRPATQAVLVALLARAKAGVRDVPTGPELAPRAGHKGHTCATAMRELIALGVIDVDDEITRAA